MWTATMVTIRSCRSCRICGKQQQDSCYGFLSRARVLVVTSGFDDDNHHESVCFIPMIDDKEIAEIYVPLEEFREERCGVVPVL